MDKEILLQILKCDPISFKLNEIEEMLDEELNKEPEEMDAELIDFLADILEKAYLKTEEEPAENLKTIRAYEILRFAAINQ